MEMLFFSEISNCIATKKQSVLLVKSYNIFVNVSCALLNLQLQLQSHKDAIITTSDSDCRYTISQE